MVNFFTELKLFIERCERCESLNTDGLFFEFQGAKIPFDIALEIYNDHFGMQGELEYFNETFEEQRDFIRLLREENARLRGNDAT